MFIHWFHTVRRRLRVGAAIAIVIAVAGCSGESTSPTSPPTVEPSLTAVWGGKPWAAAAQASLRLVDTGPDTLYFRAVSPPNPDGVMSTEELEIKVPFDGVGQYSLDSASVRMVYVVGGDGRLVVYRGAGPAAGVMTITGYDAVAMELEGTVYFTAVPYAEYAPYGPTTLFESGSFRADVHTWP